MERRRELQQEKQRLTAELEVWCQRNDAVDRELLGLSLQAYVGQRLNLFHRITQRQEQGVLLSVQPSSMELTVQLEAGTTAGFRWTYVSFESDTYGWYFLQDRDFVRFQESLDQAERQ